MKKKLLTSMLLLTAMFLMTACLKGEDRDVAYYEDTAITSFAVGTLKRTVHTKTKAGKDSTYKAKFNASKYAFYIDQTKREIYNPDSLPVGVDASKVIATIVGKSGGAIALNMKKAGATKDSLVRYVATDSLDFSSPREVRVYSNSGNNYRAYTVRVNVHKEVPNVFNWTELTANSSLGSLLGMKAVSLNGKIFVFGDNGTNTVTYATATSDGNNWALTGMQAFGREAYKNVCVMAAQLYILDNGALWKSSNGTDWTQVAVTNIHRLMGASGNKLYALNASKMLEVSADGGITWREESLDDKSALLPVQDISLCTLPLKTNSNTSRLILVGNRSATDYAGDTEAAIWGKIEETSAGAQVQPWAYYGTVKGGKYRLPRLQGLCVAGYNGGLLAVGGHGIGADKTKGFAAVYMSYDAGIVWRADTAITIPKGFTATATVFALTVDANNYVWMVCGGSGRIWKGRLTQLGWRKEQNVFKE